MSIAKTNLSHYKRGNSMLDNIELALNDLVEEINKKSKKFGVFIEVQTRDGIAMCAKDGEGVKVGKSKEITLSD